MFGLLCLDKLNIHKQKTLINAAANLLSLLNVKNSENFDLLVEQSEDLQSQ